jgi:hypothetical protein
MASGIYTLWKADVMRGVHNMASAGDTLKIILLNNSHTFTATHDGYANVSANELAGGSGYTSGGETLAGQTITTDDGDAEGAFDATDEAWTSATFSAYHTVIYNDTVAAPTADPLICSIDFGGVQTVSSGTLTIQWAAEGIINIT